MSKPELHEPLMVSPLNSLAMAVGVALFEAVAKKQLTTEQAEALENRVNELHNALLDGKVLTRQDDDTYMIVSRNEFAEADDGTLTIGGE